MSLRIDGKYPAVLHALAFVACAFACRQGMCGEKVTLHVSDGQTMRCELLKIGKSQLVVKTDAGNEQSLPLVVLSSKEVYDCYMKLFEPKNAALRFEMGAYFFKKEMFAEAKIELLEAAQLDLAFRDRADALLLKLPGASPPAQSAPPKIAAQPTPPPAVEKPAAPPKPEAGLITSIDNAEDLVAMVEDFRKKFRRKVVPPRTDAQMKEFLDKRLADLNKKVGGTWRLVETKHFYCFANVPEQKHDAIARNWNEVVYDLLCRVLDHKEGDKLWNNKLPIYYFANRRQFERFAAEIDGMPSAAMSGGYFASEGREVHICIPFNSERLQSSPGKMDAMARNTLFHEFTHAFLQLSGEDVELNRWLHEGLAQFIEFWYEEPLYSEKKNVALALREYVALHKGPPLWEDTLQRPSSGVDSIGYCAAYAKLEFLYRHFPNSYLPAMIKKIKSGMSEKDAMEATFNRSLDALENVYRQWIPEALKANFKFN